MRPARLVPVIVPILALTACSPAAGSKPVAGSGPGVASEASPSPVASGVAHLGALPSSGPSALRTSASAVSTGCSIFPADNVWHADVSKLPVAANSSALVTTIGTGAAV
ncbi:MAG TPA: hypothetical protein VGJ07_16520, partial [Rugosimonospora sp.]